MATSKADQAYDILKARIMDGTYAPGHRLVIDQLAREHQISSVPWRESLRRLEAEGWVDIVPNVGALVKTFDTDAWQRTMRLLARLEGLATSLSAANLTEEDIAQARELNRQAGEALADFDTARFGELNRQFHELLCSKCEDDRLFGLVHHEWTRLDLIRRSAFFYAPGRAQASLSEHEALLDLIEGGADPEVIETAARRHETSTLKAVMEYDATHTENRRPGGAVGMF
ncbi:GntR family transcriptional regulator [uncultured Demequina sp.]|uniref:GntR family transcriptional regulator n=1 Tax=uncultured Demequina sp. TaxID=693499 RepID=UPI0025F4C2F3|nr:GntR family transcriptional regulator [uncultured Demequina sp.]